jgi:predicted DCC family thiol-disulfide oxidoreductase YuxK
LRSLETSIMMKVVDRVFYDGHCGLCHGTVRWLVRADADGSRFHFAPLDSSTFRAAVPAPQRTALPDSFVVLTGDGRLLLRSEAVIHLLGRLGGVWRLMGAVLSWVPAPLRDAVYDGVARVRHKWFTRPPDVCPVVPPELRSRFDR